jgi:MFS family permease
MTVQHAVGALANIPGGFIVDTVGRKNYLMAISLFWVGLPYALMSLTQSYWMLVACVVLVGIGNNIWHPAVIPTLAHNYPERKGLVLSFHGMGGNVGEAIAPFVVGALLAWYSWRTVVVINVVPGLIMAVVILVYLGAFSREKEKDAGPRGGFGTYVRGFAGLLGDKTMVLMAASNAFRIMTQSGLLTFLPLYLANHLGYSSFVVGVCLMMLQVAGFIACPVGGHLSDKMGRKRVIMSSMALTAVVIVGMVLAGTSPLFIVFIALAGFFIYGTRPALQAWLLEATPKHLAGSSVGLQFAVGAIGSAVAPTVCGIIADTYDIFAAFYFLAGSIIVANMMIFFLPDVAAAQHKSATAAPQAD